MNRRLTTPLKGCRDFYPSSQVFQNWLSQKAAEACRLFGYQEYEGPILEPFSLYAAKSSEEIIKKQSFLVPQKSKGKLPFVLRPELTPTLARMVANREYDLVFPLRWWSWGRFFRYEKPQKGRGREFFQWNVDILGENSPNADAEVIALGCYFLASLGFSSKDVVVKINDRKYLDSKFSLIGLDKNKTKALYRIIDKKGKVNQVDFDAMLAEEGLDKLQIKDLQLALKDDDYSRESDWLTELFSSLTDLGVADWVEFDPIIVRGFDYYTDTVFEASLRKKTARALFGGGRYQNLITNVGGKRKLGGVGFAAGDMMLEEALRQSDLYPDLLSLSAQVLVTSFDMACFRESIQLARQLREKGVAVELFVNPKISLTKQLDYANKKGIKKVIILGSDEIKQNKATIKDMISGKQEKVEQKDLAKILKK